MSEPPSERSGFLNIYSQTTPSPNDPIGADEFYKALGILIVAWGRMEGHLVLCLITALAIAKDKKLGYRIPPTWEQRAEKWKTAFNTVPSLKRMEVIALAVLADIEDVAKDRNLLVHAIWEIFDSEAPLTMGIVAIKSKSGTKDGLEIRREKVSIDSLREISARVEALNRELHQISGFLSRVRGPPPSTAHIL